MSEGPIDVAAKYLTTTITLAKNVTTQSTLVTLGERKLESVDVYFAIGHAGLTGVNLSYGGVAILPWNQPSAFLLGNNERRYFDIGIHVSGPVTVTTRNQDKAYTHAIVLTWKLTEIELTGESTLPSVPPIVAVG